MIISYSTCQPFTAGITNDGPLTCAKISVKLTATGGLDGATYAFSRSVQTSGPTSATAMATNDGPYSVTVTNPGGCSATATTTVMSTTAPPTVSIAPSATTICAGQSTTLTASGADTYKWSTGATTAAISVSAMGPYSVTGTSTSTGCSNTATANVTVIPLPNASFTGLPASVCVDAAPLSLSTTTPGGSFSGPGISGNQFRPANATAGGPYSISYTVSSMGCSNTTSQTITVNALPSVSITPSAVTICQGQSTILTASGANTYTWSIGGQTTAAISVSMNGPYSVTGIASNGCSNTATASLTVNPLPTSFSVTGGGGYCPGGTGSPVGLSGSQTGVSYQLLLGGVASGTAVPGTNNPISFGPQSTTGIYTVLATNTNTSCTQTMSGSALVSLNALPMPSIMASGTLTCAMTSITLTAGGGSVGGPFTYTFSAGASQLGNSSVNTATVIASGTYSVTVTDANGCSATAITGVGSNTTAPSVSITPSATAVCAGQSATFAANPATGLTYRWSTNQITSTISVSLAGPYSLTVTDPATGCSNTATANLTVNALPTSYSVTGGGGYCVGDVGPAVGLAGSQPGVVYQLLLGGTPSGTAVAGTGNPITFGPQSMTGTYTVLATNTSTSCTQTMSGSAVVAVNALPTISITPSSTAICQGQSATFTATSGLASYRWNTPNNGPVLTTASISASIAGTYSLTVANSNSCSATAMASLTVNALPQVAITPSSPTICAGQNTTLTASGANTYKWSTQAITASISVSAMGPYSVTGTSTSTGCSNTATASVTVTPLPNATFTGLSTSVCVDTAPFSLSPVTLGGTFSGTGISGNQFNPATAGAGGPYSITYTVSSMGCPNSGVQQVTVNPLPMAPMIATQSGHSYSGGVSSLTISQNTGNVVLMASGCMGGTITWAGGASATLAVSTMNTGVQTFTATCTSNSTGCTSPKTTATVTVVGTTLSVLHRDATNGQTSTNTLNPYLELQNDGNTAIPYSEITVRYWLTVENYMPLLFSINYAQLGSDKVHLKYVPAATGNPTATGYIEFSFDGSAGSLGAGQNSGPIQDIINKQDYSNFDQSNDYSYVNVGQYTPNPRITAYRNGVIFYGNEPGPITSMQSVKAMLQNNTGADANSIEAMISVTNDGNVPINYGDIKVRYYFTADNTQPLVLNQVGYTALGSGNVSAQIVTISPPLANADRYLELSFSPSLGQLAPGAITGGVTYQIRHADYSGFNQNNDYSYQGTGGMMVNPHVVVFVAGTRAYGTEPGTGARQGVEEAGKLTVQVLGNPVQGSAIEVVVSGAEGQPLTLHLTDLTGRSVTTHQVERAGVAESQRIDMGSASAGMLLLRASTPTQSQTVKVLRQ